VEAYTRLYARGVAGELSSEVTLVVTIFNQVHKVHSSEYKWYSCVSYSV